jgi:hypothetical protein
MHAPYDVKFGDLYEPMRGIIRFALFLLLLLLVSWIAPDSWVIPVVLFLFYLFLP